MRFILILLLIINCASPKSRDTLSTENRTANLKIIFQNSKDNEAKLNLYLCKDLAVSETNMIKECEFTEEYHSLSKNDVINYDLPPGEYFAMIHVSDMRFIPTLYTETTKQRIKFGFKTEVSDSFFGSSHLEETRISSCQEIEKFSVSENYYCPKLILGENTQTTFRFQIEEDYEFDERGTSAIWLLTLFVSLRAWYPIPIPLLTGTFAIKRKALSYFYFLSVKNF
ncbi:MAG TPA: hypothetical protein PLX69_14230 [Leptospiraceae bacterium]|nr:hypothetical protein [Leptospiraceae bacterium]HRG75715.1 hypothetical protein [Leptospiraceae bacterium]